MGQKQSKPDFELPNCLFELCFISKSGKCKVYTQIFVDIHKTYYLGNMKYEYFEATHKLTTKQSNGTLILYSFDNNERIFIELQENYSDTKEIRYNGTMRITPSGSYIADPFFIHLHKKNSI